MNQLVGEYFYKLENKNWEEEHMDRKVPQPGQLYQHFKGMLYQIITVARHSETGEELVIYQALYGEFRTYARPLSMFLSEVDHEKYPEVTSRYRFTEIARGELKIQEQKVTQAQKNTQDQEESTPIQSVKEEYHPDVNHDLMHFLDAKECGERLEILYSIRKNIDERTMGNIEIALDLPVGEGTIEERIEVVKNNLQMMAKYENRRLR